VDRTNTAIHDAVKINEEKICFIFNGAPYYWEQCNVKYQS
jgi:hypothetical protein